MPRLETNTYPMHKDRYYVYGLFKPNGLPFYIGKGKNGRINDHFNPSKLRSNTPKHNTILKYGQAIRREILCYFDSEVAAFDFEEYLISYYGILSEGGILTNYAKSRYEYCKEKVTETAANRLYELKYPEDLIIKAYREYFTDCKTVTDVAKITGIDFNYLYYVITGAKRGKLYNEYVKSGTIINNREKFPELVIKNELSSRSYKISDADVVDMYLLVCIGEYSLNDLSDKYGISEKYFQSVFQGVKRKHLNLSLNRDSVRRCIGLPTSKLRTCVSEIDGGVPVNEVARVYGIPKTTLHRSYRTYKSVDFDAELSRLRHKFSDALNTLQSPPLSSGNKENN